MASELSAGVLDEQLATLREMFPQASMENAEGGAVLITVPDVPLPPGWNQTATTVRFLAPAGYPMARPDCFWTDPSVRLASGGMPQNGGLNSIPGRTDQHMWFSWHLQAWNPLSDSLVTFLRVIQTRFLMQN